MVETKAQIDTARNTSILESTPTSPLFRILWGPMLPRLEERWRPKDNALDFKWRRKVRNGAEIGRIRM